MVLLQNSSKMTYSRLSSTSPSSTAPPSPSLPKEDSTPSSRPLPAPRVARPRGPAVAFEVPWESHALLPSGTPAPAVGRRALLPVADRPPTPYPRMRGEDGAFSAFPGGDEDENNDDNNNEDDDGDGDAWYRLPSGPPSSSYTCSDSDSDGGHRKPAGHITSAASSSSSSSGEEEELTWEPSTAALIGLAATSPAFVPTYRVRRLSQFTINSWNAHFDCGDDDDGERGGGGERGERKGREEKATGVRGAITVVISSGFLFWHL